MTYGDGVPPFVDDPWNEWDHAHGHGHGDSRADGDGRGRESGEVHRDPVRCGFCGVTSPLPDECHCWNRPAGPHDPLDGVCNECGKAAKWMGLTLGGVDELPTMDELIAMALGGNVAKAVVLDDDGGGVYPIRHPLVPAGPTPEWIARLRRVAANQWGVVDGSPVDGEDDGDAGGRD